MKFKLKSNFAPTNDQETAVNSLISNYNKNLVYQVLLGVTGSGKTFTIANVIERLQKPALIISHNKTLAAQLYQEFKIFFPENAVSYFVSYYDFYQPEAYIPSTDTYIEKDADINELIDKLRLQTTANLLTRNDAIVVASVSSIYNIGSPKEYGNFTFEMTRGLKIDRKAINERLIDLQYEREDFGFHRGTFRVIGDAIDIYPAYQDEGVRLELGNDVIKEIKIINPVSGETLTNKSKPTTSFVLYPAKHFITDPSKNTGVFEEIRADLEERVTFLKKEGKDLEAHRLKLRVKYDLEMIAEVGYVKGIENYSRYFDGRKPGDPPYSLIDYFKEPYKDDWLVFIDESHMTFPQIRGMYNGDIARKKILVDYGFRLPAAFDNRPLTFDEFMRKIPGFIATSATPSEWEINISKESACSIFPQGYKLNQPDGLKRGATMGVTEQLLRPTGIPDPEVEIRPTKSQVTDCISEIGKTKEKGQRTLVTTLTKKTAEDLAQFLKEKGVNVQYLHSDVATLERSDILENLRKGEYDALVGVNLLREGLDLPEVSLVAILDADKEGFLRSEVSLIQTMGRAARHIEGRVILYADKVTGSMERAISEVGRRRKYQLSMNKKYHITPTSIQKPIRERLVEEDQISDIEKLLSTDKKALNLPLINTSSLTIIDKRKLIIKLRQEMKLAARDLNFELAAQIRDKIYDVSSTL